MNPHNKRSIVPASIALIAVVALGFSGYKYFATAEKLEDTEAKLAQKTVESEQRIIELEGNFLRVAQEKDATIATLQGQLNSAHQSVQDLEILAKTDKELLQKYSKVYFLNEHYTPPMLAYVEGKYLDDKNKDTRTQIHDKVWPYLKRMLDDARAAGIDLTVVSAFRSFGEQTALKANYKVTYGAGTANQFSADQGYSEHQLGTAVDFGVKGGAPFTKFEDTAAYNWLTANAQKYGFTLSYPEGNTYYQFEPWHWRFVGLTLSHDLKDQGKFFYDMDQRDLDKYLLTLFN